MHYLPVTRSDAAEVIHPVDAYAKCHLSLSHYLTYLMVVTYVPPATLLDIG